MGSAAGREDGLNSTPTLPSSAPVTSCATSCAASCAASFTCPSFTCRPGALWGAACVCWAWVPPLEDGACHNEYFRAPVLRGAQHALRLLQSDCTAHSRSLDSVLSTAPNTSSATSCVTSPAMSCAASFTCPSFTCHLRESVRGCTRVFGVRSAAGKLRWARRAPLRSRLLRRPVRSAPRTAPRLSRPPAPRPRTRPAPHPSRARPSRVAQGQHGVRHHDKCLHAPVLRGAQHVLCHVLGAAEDGLSSVSGGTHVKDEHAKDAA